MKGKVKKLVSFGGPMMGTSQVPFCLEGVTCYIVNSLVDFFVYNKNIQKNIGPSAYYRTAAHINNYKKSNSLLVKLNNPSQKEKQNFIDLDILDPTRQGDEGDLVFSGGLGEGIKKFWRYENGQWVHVNIMNITMSTLDIEPGVTDLETGALYLVYE